MACCQLEKAVMCNQENECGKTENDYPWGLWDYYGGLYFKVSTFSKMSCGCDQT